MKPIPTTVATDTTVVTGTFSMSMTTVPTARATMITVTVENWRIFGCFGRLWEASVRLLKTLVALGGEALECF